MCAHCSGQRQDAIARVQERYSGLIAGWTGRGNDVLTTRDAQSTQVKQPATTHLVSLVWDVWRVLHGLQRAVLRLPPSNEGYVCAPVTALRRAMKPCWPVPLPVFYMTAVTTEMDTNRALTLTGGSGGKDGLRRRRDSKAGEWEEG